MGEKKDNVAILPLIGDMSFPPTGPAPDLYTDALQSLPKGLFENARLEVGQKQDGVGVVSTNMNETEIC